MALPCFEDTEFLAVSEALDISEDATGNFYKFSHRQWKRHRYDVKTLLSLRAEEITCGAFALLNKADAVENLPHGLTKIHDHYWICLQDHQILSALRRDKDLSLLALMVYVFTHELVHIVRFANFVQRFDTAPDKRIEEENRVHCITHDILSRVTVPKLGYVLDAYHGHNICDTNLCYRFYQ